MPYSFTWILWYVGDSLSYPEDSYYHTDDAQYNKKIPYDTFHKVILINRIKRLLVWLRRFLGGGRRGVAGQRAVEHLLDIDAEARRWLVIPA